MAEQMALDTGDDEDRIVDPNVMTDKEVMRETGQTSLSGKQVVITTNASYWKQGGHWTKHADDPAREEPTE